MSGSVRNIIGDIDGIHKINQSGPKNSFVINCSNDSTNTVKSKLEENGFTVSSEQLVYDNVDGGSFKRLRGEPSERTKMSSFEE